MPLTDRDLERVDERAELQVRRYFDHYLQEVFPHQMAAHNADDGAHGSVAKKLTKLKWLLIGLALAGGAGSGAAFAKLLATLP